MRVDGGQEFLGDIMVIERVGLDTFKVILSKEELLLIKDTSVEDDFSLAETLLIILKIGLETYFHV